MNEQRDPKKCNGTVKSTGRQCQKAPIAGGRVCRFHGGAAPQVKQAAAQVVASAREKMQRELVPQAVRRVEKILKDPKSDPKDVLRASAMVFDRTGLLPGTTLTVEQVRELPPAELLRLHAEGVRERLVAAGVVPADIEERLALPAPGEEDVVDAEIVGESAEHAEVLPFRPPFI